MNRVVLPALASLVLSLACVDCGYIGEPLPPALNLPNRVTDLAAVQRGDQLIVQFTLPTETTEAQPLKTAPEIDLRVGPSGPRFDLRDWLEHAKRLPQQEGVTRYESPAAGYTGKDVVIGLRLINDRGRDAGWSNFVALHVTPAVSRPQNVAAHAVPQGVSITWTGSGTPLYRIYRKGATGEFAPLGDQSTSPYLDTTAEFGKTYSYFVQGFLRTGQQTSESDISDTVSITPKDEFPPAVPSHPKAIAGARAIEISWDRNVEPDLAGYRVFRAEGNGAYSLLADRLISPAYSDRSAKPGVAYRYAITAVDLSGNESPRSPVIEAALP